MGEWSCFEASGWQGMVTASRERFPFHPVSPLDATRAVLIVDSQLLPERRDFQQEGMLLFYSLKAIGQALIVLGARLRFR